MQKKVEVDGHIVSTDTDIQHGSRGTMRTTLQLVVDTSVGSAEHAAICKAFNNRRPLKLDLKFELSAVDEARQLNATNNPQQTLNKILDILERLDK